MSTLRTAGLVVAGFVSAGAGVIGMYAFRDEQAAQLVPTATPVEVTSAAIARELGAAAAAGFGAPVDVSASARADDGALQLPVAIGARECVAVVAGVSGFQRLTGLILAAPGAEGPVAEAAVDRPDGAAGQVQFCAVEPTTVTVRVETTRRSHERPARYTASVATVLVARAPWATLRGFAGLRRGHLDPAAVVFAGRGAVWDDLAAQRPPGASPAGPATDVDRAHAAVTPPSLGLVTWYATLTARATGTPMGHPRIAWDRSTDDWRALEAALPTSLNAHNPIVDLEFNDFRRVLLAAEGGPAGSGCVTVILGRARYRTRPQVWRWTGTGSPEVVPEAGNFARDVVCPGAPRRLYLTAASNDDVYRVETWR